MQRLLYLLTILLFTFTSLRGQTRMVAEVWYKYDGDLSKYVLGDSIIYKYSNGRGGAIGEVMHYDTSIQYFNRTTGIGLWFKHTQGFNLFGLVASNSEDFWDETNSQPPAWRHNEYEKFVYGPNGRVHIDSMFVYNGAGIIRPNTAGVNQYNDFDKITDSFIYLNNWSTTLWDTQIHCHYIYDNLGRLSQEICRESLGKNMTDRMRYTYSYLGNSALPIYRADEYYNGNNNWLALNAKYYVYNTRGNLFKEYDLVRPYTGAGMDTLQCTTYFYGADQNIIEVKTQMFSKSTQAWYNTGRTLYTYNADGHRTSQINQGWDKDLNQYAPYPFSDSWFYYYETYTPSAVTELKLQGGALQLYPIPANNILNVNIDWDVPQAYTLTITDMQGCIIMQYSSKEEQQAVDISTLPIGIYNLILKGDKGGVQHNKFSVVK